MFVNNENSNARGAFWKRWNNYNLKICYDECMNTYIFILGRNAELSKAEIQAVFFSHGIKTEKSRYLILTGDAIDCQKAMSRLGGCIKIGEWLADGFTARIIAEDILKTAPEKRAIFGISDYADSNMKAGGQKTKKAIISLGMEIKKIIKDSGISTRFVTSREPVLSSVVVQKNKCQEYIIADGSVYRTCAVQDFEDYSFRDYSRPRSDSKSGMLPPKLAKIMINLSGADPDDIILDPFCGSGTILQEALVMGYKNIIGSDSSNKAVEDSKMNIEWLGKHYNFHVGSCKIIRADVRALSEFVTKADVVVTEPYLGPAQKGNESAFGISAIRQELDALYVESFHEFAKILEKGAKVVFVFPVFSRHKSDNNELIQKIQQLGFFKTNARDIFYSRPGQRVERQIAVFKKR